MTPIIAEKGSGAEVIDADGNRYLDFCCSWGTLILGHAHPAVVEAAADQVKNGSSFGMATRYELELAEKIVSHHPAVEKIRFVSSGTEATMSALRLARGYTGRDLIVKFDGHYHGHSDGLLIHAGSGVKELSGASSKGVPADFVKHTVSLPFNDVETCRAFIRQHDTIAAVILEPVAGNMGVTPATREFLEILREETTKKGIVLIFDEVITGYRVGLHSAQGYFGISPDLSCFAKIIGGGFPAAAFGGQAEIMHRLAPLGDVYQAGTLSGNPVAMRAGLAVLQELEKPGVYEELEAKTNFFLEPLRDLPHRQVGSMFTLFLEPAQYRELFVTLFHKGIYLPPAPYESSFISTAHTYAQLDFARSMIADRLHPLKVPVQID